MRFEVMQTRVLRKTRFVEINTISKSRKYAFKFELVYIIGFITIRTHLYTQIKNLHMSPRSDPYKDCSKKSIDRF